MATTMTADMVRGGLNPFLERAEQPRSFTPDEVRELLQNPAIPLALLDALWDQAKNMMDAGIEHGQLVAVLTELLTLIQRSSRAFEDVLANASDLGIGSNELASLNRSVQELGKMQGIVAEKLSWLDTALPPLDAATLPARSGERAVAGFVSTADLAARLRAGKTD